MDVIMTSIDNNDNVSESGDVHRQA